MPKLARFVRDNADLAERFLVVGVHQKGGGSIPEIRATVAAKEAISERLKTELLPVVVLDEEQGMFLRYDPQGLGDTVLLDPAGRVVAVDEGAVTALRTRLAELRDRVAALVSRLGQAKAPADVATLLADLCNSGTVAGDAAAERYVLDCPPALAAIALQTMAQQGRPAPVVAALRHKDAKRRRAAVAVTLDHPSREWVAPLLELAGKKGNAEEAHAALRAAHASGPEDASVESLVLDLSARGDIPMRAVCVELLGKIGSPFAKDRLLALLPKDNSPKVRAAAAAALAALGGDAAVAALQRSASEDKADSVRAAARQALDALASKAPAPAPGK